MKPTSGILVSYTDKDGNLQKAIMYHKDQNAEARKANKALLYLMDDNFKPKIENGKPVTAMKSISDLTNNGFID